MLTEFELIRRFFTRDTRRAVLGVGDDCALLAVPPGRELAVTTDMLVCGVHFFADARPEWLGHKALAVNLSDLAAMGAEPRWALLALALPAADEAWVAAFVSGFFSLADRYGVELIGGDTTRGPLNICITAGGELPAGSALRRDGAKAGDEVWVSGTTGDAALALAGLRHEVALAADDAIKLGERLHRPMPRVELGIALRGVASSAIDVSDGLAADLGHVLLRSGCGASVDFASLPRSAELQRCTDHAVATRCAIAGGDDYELCFTAAPEKRGSIAAISADLRLPLTMIGRIDTGQGLRVRDEAGRAVAFDGGGYEHFR